MKNVRKMSTSELWWYAIHFYDKKEDEVIDKELARRDRKMNQAFNIQVYGNWKGCQY